MDRVPAEFEYLPADGTALNSGLLGRKRRCAEGLKELGRQFALFELRQRFSSPLKVMIPNIPGL
jgi:hypothetical protein